MPGWTLFRDIRTDQYICCKVVEASRSDQLSNVINWDDMNTGRNNHMARAKIICTLGPATSSPEMVEGLIKNGMNVARINYSHGEHDDFRTLIETVREVSSRLGQPVAILGDLCGPKIRIGELVEPEIMLTAGDDLVITTKDVVGDSARVSTTYDNLPSDIERGNRILIDDGRLELKVVDVRSDEVNAKVIIGGILKPHKGMNLPGVNVSAPAVNNKDMSDIEFSCREGVDYIALSFVRDPRDIVKTKRLITNFGSDIPVIAKIEKDEAVRAFDRVLQEADGIMIARGDLGVEMASEEVPIIQKNIIKACNEAGKPVITATQMLESMTSSPRPTRAETSDVANAIIDGSDAVMLSGETAVGEYPLRAAATMSAIIRTVEGKLGKGRSMFERRPRETTIEEAVTAAACRAAELLKAKLIVAYTQSGSTMTRISKQRPMTRIMAITPYEHIRRRLELYWGVRSALVSEVIDTDSMVDTASDIAKSMGFAHAGDIIVVTSGTPIGVSGSTNLMNVHRVK